VPAAGPPELPFDTLRLIRERPADPFTVASLADGASQSRATLARRFARLVGEPPLAYVT
jgi:transcriptional regulator GlxA family with amidase domain